MIKVLKIRISIAADIITLQDHLNDGYVVVNSAPVSRQCVIVYILEKK